MGFAAAELGVQPEDGPYLLRPTQDAHRDQPEDRLQALGRVGVGEEEVGPLVLVWGVAAEHLGEVGSEVALAQRPLKNVSSGRTD